MINTKEETEMLAADAKIYEVVRVMDGKPVFLKEHFDRMNESIRLSRIKGRLDYEGFYYIPFKRNLGYSGSYYNRPY
jgi:branched-chain amino acid aminotransferase